MSKERRDRRRLYEERNKAEEEAAEVEKREEVDEAEDAEELKRLNLDPETKPSETEEKKKKEEDKKEPEEITIPVAKITRFIPINQKSFKS